MTGKHTPGPWCAMRQPDGYTAVLGPVPDENISRPVVVTSAGIAFSDYSRRVQEANARLIAAAPDLLALLKEAVSALADGIETESEYEPEHSRFARSFVTKARAAISKATGDEA